MDTTKLIFLMENKSVGNELRIKEMAASTNS